MFWILAFVGWVVGTLINWLADSLPEKGRLDRPRCQVCAEPRPVTAWSALLAYVVRRHRCPSCSAPLAWRYIVVELATALLFGVTWLRTGASVTTVLSLFYGAVFVLILVTDLEHRLIQHVITLPAIVLAIIGAFVNPTFDSPARSLLGGAVGLVATYGIYLLGGLFARLMERIRGEPITEVAFGFGDVTLNTFIGLIVGAPEIIFAMVIGFLIGGVVASVFLLVQGAIKRRYTAFTAIPYGPFLILGGSVMLYFGQEFMAWYTHR